MARISTQQVDDFITASGTIRDSEKGGNSSRSELVQIMFTRL
jgi:hypothetical protein